MTSQNTPPSSSELLPCPFCGGEARADRGSVIAWVECRTPGCDGQQIHDELEDAIAAWNTRAKDTPQGDDVAIDVEQWVRSKPDDVRESGWQPIETAPRDGTGVLVICMGAPQPVAGQGWYIGGKWTTIDPSVEAEFGEDFYHASTWFAPTHWRELPEPPAITAIGSQSIEPRKDEERHA